MVIIYFFRGSSVHVLKFDIFLTPFLSYASERFLNIFSLNVNSIHLSIYDNVQYKLDGVRHL